MQACETSNQEIADHFVDATKMVTLGSAALRELDDVHLSRYACYLVVQNGDPSKPVIAAGQTYFALQTRRIAAQVQFLRIIKNASGHHNRRRFFRLQRRRKLVFPAFQQYAGVHATETEAV